MARLATESYREVFGERGYRWFWFGFAGSVLGDAMTQVALTWLVYESTNSARALGWLTLCYTGPILLGGLLAGWLLDRFDRRRVMALDSAVRGGAVALIPLLSAMGRLELWHIYAVAAVYGLLMMISLAGGPALVPSLVKPDQLPTANALEMLGFTIGGVAGPPLAGLLITRIGAPNVMVIDAISYFAFTLALLAAHPRSDAEVEPASSGEGHGLGRAVRLMIGNPILLATTLMFLAYNVGGGLLTVWLPVLVDRTLDGGPGLYGTLLATLAVGQVVSIVLTGLLRPGLPLGTLICAAQFLSGASLLVVFGTRNLWGTVLGLLLYGALGAPLTVWAQTLRMRIIPPRLRGRTFALLRTLMQGGTPLGGTAAGLLLPVVGIPAMIALSVIVIAGPGMTGLRVAELRTAGRPDAERLPTSV